MQNITKRQQKILNFIVKCIHEDGRPPTNWELCSHFGWKSDNAARQHLHLLEKKGVIELSQGRSRGIRLTEAITSAQTRDVSLVGRVAAGLPIEAIENIDGQVGVDTNIFPEKELFALRVKGDSMIDVGILDGDLALIKKSAHAELNEIVVAIVNGEATVKRLRRKAGRIILHAENPEFTDIVVSPKDEFSIAGVVVGIMRHF